MIRQAALIFLGGFSFLASATTVESYWTNREALKKFEDKSYYSAYQGFMRALEVDPLNPEIHLNLARTFEANEEYDKAEKGYRAALRLLPEDSALRFQTLFNLAGVLAKNKKIDEALENYQACLEMVPDSKEVKTNIELLFQNGGGGGDGKENQDQKGQNQQQQKDGQGQQDKKDQKDQPNDSKDQKEQKKQPKPFESQDLTPQDVKKILDEIKNQEQAVRAQEYERNAKEAPRGKDW